ncbi:MAG: glycosyltransferase [Devosia sp.]
MKTAHEDDGAEPNLAPQQAVALFEEAFALAHTPERQRKLIADLFFLLDRRDLTDAVDRVRKHAPNGEDDGFDDIDPAFTGGDASTNQALADELAQRGALSGAAFLLRELHAAAPEDMGLVEAILANHRHRRRQSEALAALVDGCITPQTAQSYGPVMSAFVSVLGASEGAGAVASAMVRIMTRLVGTPHARGAIVPLLPAADHLTAIHEIAAGRQSVDLDVFVGWTDALSFTGMFAPAGEAFAAIENDIRLSPHLAVLGARIAIQNADFEALERRKAICEEGAAQNPTFAENNPIYHIAVADPRAAPDVRRANAGEIARLATAGRLNPEFILDVYTSEPILPHMAGLLGDIATTDGPVSLVKASFVLSSLLRGDSPVGLPLEEFCGPQALLHNSRIRRAMFALAFKNESERDDGGDLLLRADLADPAIVSAIHKQIMHWRADDRLDKSLTLARRVLDLRPGEHWARMTAIQVAHEAGLLEDAIAIADYWNMEEPRGVTIVDAARSFARLGVSDTAERLFQRADNELGPTTLPADATINLARGLLLYGDYEKAVAWYERIQPAVTLDLARPAVIDPGYTDNAGHHTNYCDFAAGMLESVWRVPPVLAVGARANTQHLAGHDVARAFHFEPYTYNEFELANADINRLNAMFCAECTRLYGTAYPPAIFIHSMRFNMLAGFLEWLSRTTPAGGCVAIVGLIEADHLQKPDLVRLDFEPLARWSAALKERGDIRLVIYAETDQAVEWLSDSIPDVTIDKYPYLAASRAREHRGAILGDPNRRLTVGTLGATRKERGFATLLEAMATAGPQSPVDWRVQINPDHLAMCGERAVKRYEELTREREDVTFLHGFLDGDQYYSALSQLDAFVLPYADRYVVSGSGVLYEAVYALRYLIVSEGSTMAAELAQLQYPHATVDPDDPTALLEAVRRMAADWPQIQQALAEFDARGPALPLERFQDRVGALAPSP